MNAVDFTSPAVILVAILIIAVGVVGWRLLFGSTKKD